MRMARALVSAAVAVSLVAVSVGADTITTTGGEKIVGKVKSFKRDHDTAAGSVFVIEVDGEEISVPLRKIDDIAFAAARGGTAESGVAGAARRPAATATTDPRPQAEKTGEDGKSGKHWLSGSGKRHNESCRYYGSGKGRPCGASDGVACKLCGG